MTLLPTTLSMAAAAALINFWLALRCGQVRAKEKVSVGHGGNEMLERRMRAQLNFAENTPWVLMLIALLRILPRTFADKWTAWLEDRALIALLVGLAMVAGLAGPLVYGLCVVLALVGIFGPRPAPVQTPPATGLELVTNG